MKTIEYRGGVVTFRVPSNWKEEYEENGGGIFYEDAPDSGTLRLNILTFQTPPGKLPACGFDELTRAGGADGVSIIRLPNGDGIKHYRKQTHQDGELLDLYYWEVAHCAPPQQYFLAIFSYTILAAQSSEPSFRQEIQMLTEELKEMRFHPELDAASS